MKKSGQLNLLLGWVVFLVSFLVYFLTVEPTASWWDCSEIITAAFKLEVGHPPGAPVHMLLGRIFALFAFNTKQVAFMVNLLSALASVATVMFLYWSIVHLAGKLFRNSDLTAAEQIAVWGCGLTGALSFAFTDSFWFSAVESEVYALSSFFTAAVFWCILKWESRANEPGSDRWIILIAYLIGLSTGVHLLSLLVIPVAGTVYFFRKYDFTWSGLIKVLFLSLIILGGIQYFLIPGTAGLGFLVDKFFVNTLGFPFNSGLLFMILFLFMAISGAIYFTYRRKMTVWNTVLTALLVFYIGFSSYSLIVIRSSANPPMNQNHPDNAFSLRKYLNRDQYGNRPLFYGQYFNAPIMDFRYSGTGYSKVGNRYRVTARFKDKPVFDSRFETLFPRMYSSDPQHIEVYSDWADIRGKSVTVTEEGKTRNLIRPTFTENIRFFLNYQLGYMYFRYFMWNFAGRQNDIQGQGGFRYGNWVSGFSILDELRTGPKKMLPAFLKKDPSENVYFFLPLLLGLWGFFYQYRQGSAGRRGFWIVFLLFMMTGIAIVIYLNQTPVQPRERDYSYTGLFYAFSIWIGLGVLALFSAFKNILSEKSAAISALTISLLTVPGILLAQNYRDHDRSGRYMVSDYTRNYLESCPKDAILFTYSDNDTFPLWYMQEVEGVRPDVRVINIGLLGMDWYISQLNFRQNKADPVRFSWGKEKYFAGTRDYVLVIDRNKEAADLSSAMLFAGRDDDNAKVEVASGEKYNYFPSKNLFIRTDRKKMIENGIVRPEDEKMIADSVLFAIDKSYLTKSELAVLNIIAANNWERPICFNHSLLYSGSMFFRDWLQFDGLTYRLIPIRTPGDDENTGRIDTGSLYETVMKKYTWGNVNSPDVYLDSYNKHEIMLMQARFIFTRLAKALNDEGKPKQAEEVLDRLSDIFPDHKIPLTFDSFPAVEQYYRAGAFKKGTEVALTLTGNSIETLEYYLSLPEELYNSVEDEKNREIEMLRSLSSLAAQYGQVETEKTVNQRTSEIIRKITGKKRP